MSLFPTGTLNKIVQAEHSASAVQTLSDKKHMTTRPQPRKQYMSHNRIISSVPHNWTLKLE